MKHGYAKTELQGAWVGKATQLARTAGMTGARIDITTASVGCGPRQVSDTAAGAKRGTVLSVYLAVKGGGD